ncbi:MAG: hypothetical protein ACKPKO_31670, partial [Candidatus Fonsibacter sp.]
CYDSSRLTFNLPVFSGSIPAHIVEAVQLLKRASGRRQAEKLHARDSSVSEAVTADADDFGKSH